MKDCIGVFDSGIGGLTVLKKVREAFPNENYIYLGDTARLPYGSKNPKTIRLYLEQCLNFLSQFKPKAYIVACNSASTQIVEKTWAGQPLFNVIDPVIKEGLKISQNKKIGVLGTRATINSHTFLNRLKKEDPNATVFEQECPLFVPLAEEGWIHDPITNLIVYRYLTSLIQEKVDTAILGCTHYPLLKDSIQKVFGASVNLIEAGPLIVQSLQEAFSSGVITPGYGSDFKFYVTDKSPHLELLAKELLSLAPDFQTEWVHLNQTQEDIK